MRPLILLLPFLLLSLLPCSSMARTWHVPSEAPTIQAGIDSAGVGDTVLVAPGIYMGNGNRDIDFGGKDLVVLGSQGSSCTVIECEGTESEPHRGFRFHSGETSGSVIEGLTIRNGWGPRDGPGGISVGGGISIDGSNPRIVDCVFQGNDVYHRGGALWCESASPEIASCVFLSNYAGVDGGGVYLLNSYSVITACLFRANSAFGQGGGMYCAGSSSPVVEG